MEEKTSKKEALRTKGKKWYDKRLILDIVKQVEEGVPREQINKKYGLGKCALNNWMQKYGSENYHLTKRRIYTSLEKSTIVAAIEQSRMTVREARVSYQVCSEKSIRDWLSKSKREKGSFSVPIQDMAKRKKTSGKTDSENAELYKTLQEAQLKIMALNTMIDVAEEQLKIDIRKKSGAKPSSE